MADNKPAYTIATLGVFPVVKFTDGANTEYSPVFKTAINLVAGVQVAQFLVSVPSAGGVVWKDCSLCLWEKFEAPAGPPA
jgi:hypothetical protein